MGVYLKQNFYQTLSLLTLLSSPLKIDKVSWACMHTLPHACHSLRKHHHVTEGAAPHLGQESQSPVHLSGNFESPQSQPPHTWGRGLKKHLIRKHLIPSRILGGSEGAGGGRPLIITPKKRQEASTFPSPAETN